MSVYRLVTASFADFLRVLSPRYCPVCGRRLVAHEAALCGACLASLPYMRVGSFSDNAVVRQLLALLPLHYAYSHIIYGKGAGAYALLAAVKYHHRPDLARLMGQLMGAELAEVGFFGGMDGIVPVPLHWRRRLSRGYNQSLQLALGLGEAAGIPVCPGVVRRVVDNPSQTHVVGDAERRGNVEGIFRARPTRLGHILLVDDVLTTGATIVSCARSIMECNPDVKFSVVTLAKA
ncbi:MAG: ComF family protein [Prevotellaceae bacterium]|nr:ComF family protein [Prevotellaceae bacterium]